MTLDKPEHREVLLELLDKAQFIGAHAELVVELKQAIREATVAKKARKHD